ncbi:twitching motility protein [Desulforhopalus sp. IMCC35007]|uniref:twitching motility protein n=1 Tax=Desulforhopalus sp. IMCC35007 TaxID=2569543 RepID=UPI0010AE3D0C|nr:twitching motility protein [Desulforhopalus sp. IMCC35007]TKB06326.1 twitching motility protein [Desulforhopalus sp. IMCC35007]
MELTKNQAALILDASEDGEITVDIALSDEANLAGALCQAIATKLMNDENFQTELMQMVEGDTMN